ncbi:peptidase inhibitor family I36 protein [Salinibacterium sp.]|uniref:peptidase inhibitor family I36 protein n=1 Tax=Salinibacterium sp. TaxID=1915057 RepID=UPI00286BD7DA|nr:peptidase inhibitor family I36 protein [Salinibacterium sp.]
MINRVFLDISEGWGDDGGSGRRLAGSRLNLDSKGIAILHSRLIARASAVVLAAASLGAAATTAATAAPSDCPTNAVCIYDNANYGAQLGWRTGGFGLQDVSAGNNDKMSSWANNSVYNACWYGSTLGSGSACQMNQYSQNPDIGWPYGDSMTSGKGSSC